MAALTLVSGTQTLLHNDRPNRRRLVIQALSTIVITGNTGRVHIGYGFQPQGTAGNPAGGDILTQGAYVDKNEELGTLGPAHKRQVWALAQGSDMVIDVIEEVSEEEEKK